MFRATKACTFSTSQLPKVLPGCGALYILTSKCVSRHNGVHFFDISTSKSGPSVVCVVHFDLETCFAPQRRATFYLLSGHMAPHPPLWRAYFSTLQSHKSLEKQSVSRLFCPFAHMHLLSSDSFSSLIFSLLLFSSLTLLTSAFSSVHIVGSLTSKLPSKLPSITSSCINQDSRYIHIHAHTHLQLYTCAYSCTCIRIHIHIVTCWHFCEFTYACTYRDTYTYTYIYIYTYTYAYAYACTCTCMHACMHTYIHTCTHTYMHTYRRTDRQTERQTDIYIYMNIYTDVYTFPGIAEASWLHITLQGLSTKCALVASFWLCWLAVGPVSIPSEQTSV